jgi:hypothetical protein
MKGKWIKFTKSRTDTGIGCKEEKKKRQPKQIDIYEL